MKLNNEEINRYSRHLTLPEVGMAGQLEIKESRVLMIGAGGLGSPLGMYLGAVGVGKIGLVDFDVVDHTNLHRQIAHTTADEGRPKVESLEILFWQETPILKLKFTTLDWSVTMCSICSVSMTSSQMVRIILRHVTLSMMLHFFPKNHWFLLQFFAFRVKSQFFLLRPEARVTVVFILNLRRQRSFRVELLQVSWACSRA